MRFCDFVAGVECEIARCEWPDGRPKQGHVQEAAREVRLSSLFSGYLVIVGF